MLSFVSLLLIIVLFQNIDCQYFNQCDVNIYHGCNHQSQFSERELETVRVWLQQYMLQAPFKPRQPPCKHLLVSKDFKCLSSRERTQFAAVIRQLYRNGVMDRLTDVHQRYWPEVHKTGQLGPWHRWFVNVLQNEMRQISPDITIPYWSAQTDSAHPERSIVWRTLGRSGIQYTGYCVRDGMYADLNTTRCIRRQWSGQGGRIPPLDGLELNTIWMQLTKTALQSHLLMSGLHFNTHLGVGGYYGDMSVDTAPHDITFYLWHNYMMNIAMLKQQLQKKEYLTPRDWNHVPAIDQMNGQIRLTSIESDKLIYYTNVPLLEAFHVGFGQLCTIPDQIVVAILQKIRNQTMVPTAIRRLSPSLKAMLFPKLLNNSFDAFTHMFEEVGDCNRECRPIPMFEPYVATENGRRTLRRYAYDKNLRADWLLILSQAFYKTVINVLNRAGYCSPYVTI